MSETRTGKNEGRPYGGVSAGQREALRLKKFVEAGTDLIGGDGFHAATVRVVCRKAGLTERYFYEAFSNREDLLMAVYRSSVAQLSERLVRAVQGPFADTEAMIRAAVHAALSWLKEDPRQARILYFEMLGSCQSIEHVFLEYTKGFADLILQLLAPTTGRKRGNGYDREFMAASIVGAFDHFVCWWALTGYDTPLDEMVDKSVAIFMALIRPAIEGGPGGGEKQKAMPVRKAAKKSPTRRKKKS